ncbi:hypothetical protein NB699_001071 [Xanthomonas sacchari]|uniref:SMI1/KNR4 family protein n=1 Tax=Xanthomonas sacchari TaxID=56458 RepID=A0AA46YAQ6_9XANT|nr:SMI1/KNR4 family protein [Xanthomonas sacchari]MCW0366088.1 hypothetical protein [Xanthomonas sacchari]MCW0440152.1 hypothetical protein [Xanthomonas sacchari]UYK90431.1 SMI1/KNR4 family protein [Xanthomonas sacchari]
MSVLSDFEALSRATGMVLPPLLRALLDTGDTSYFPHWCDAWKHPDQPRVVPFLSWWDYEWIDAAESRRNIDEWLHPQAQAQGGRSFLPFAQSGAGDLYCLMADAAGSIGVALAWHDNDTCRIGYRTFDDFVYARYLETLSDASHLIDEAGDLTADRVAADIRCVSRFMDTQRGEQLRQLCQRPLALRAFRPGPRAGVQHVPAFISQEELELHLTALAAPSAPFSLTPRWEMRRPDAVAVVAPPPPQWRDLAKDPGRRMQAIRTYQRHHACTLQEAKRAIDGFLAAAHER